MATRKKTTRKASPLAGRVASVEVERNGAAIRVDFVDARHAGIVLADILKVFRSLTPHFPELVPTLDPVEGGTPLHVPEEDGWSDKGKHRVGF